MYDYDRRIAGVPATVGGFLAILKAHMTQWDMVQQAAAAKKNRNHNIYALGHLLGAVERIEQQVGSSAARSSDPEDLQKLRAAIPKFLHDAPYVRKTLKSIDEFLEKGKAPNYPVQKQR